MRGKKSKRQTALSNAQLGSPPPIELWGVAGTGGVFQLHTKRDPMEAESKKTGGRLVHLVEKPDEVHPEKKEQPVPGRTREEQEQMAKFERALSEAT
jgi:hypothetical protein